MKKHKLKPRYLFLIISLTVMIIAYLIYAVSVGHSYCVSETVGGESVDLSTVKAVCTDENVIRIKSVTENKRDDDMYILNVEIESVNTGSAELKISYPLDDDIIEINSKKEILVLPFGFIYDKTFNSFTAMNLAVPLEMAMLLLIVIVMSISFAEKMKQGRFSYAMAVLGGIILFLSLTLITTLTDEHFWCGLSQPTNVASLLDLFVNSWHKFISITTIPVILLAAALAISNIWLAIKEGFRPQNALGVIIGALIIGGLFVINLSNKYNGADSIIYFYALMLTHLCSTILFCYFECMLISIMFCAVASTRYKPEQNMDYIVILGCAIRRDGTPTPLLRGRVQRAVDFENEQFRATGKHAKYVPSGGQGSDEIISEAESMKRCLMELGVSEDRIIKEDKSVNTYQNMAFSKKVIEEDTEENEDINIAFSTTNYHVFRGYTLAKKVGMTVKGLSAKTKLYFFPNAFIREFIGLLWEQKIRHIISILLIILSVVAMYVTIIY